MQHSRAHSDDAMRSFVGHSEWVLQVLLLRVRYAAVKIQNTVGGRGVDEGRSGQNLCAGSW